MNTIKTTELFDRWFDRLKDRKAKARIQVRIDRQAPSATVSRWEAESPKCASTTGQATGCISADIETALKLARDLEKVTHGKGKAQEMG